MSTSGSHAKMDPRESIDIPLLGEWIQLRRERTALRERLTRLESERGRVSEEVLERVRADYQEKVADLDLRASDLAGRAETEARALAAAVARQKQEVDKQRLAYEEYDLRQRLGEVLDAVSAKRAADLRSELSRLEDDLKAMIEMRDRVATIAEGTSGGQLPDAPSPRTGGVRAEILPPIPPAVPPPVAAPTPAAGARLIPSDSRDGSDAFVLRERTLVGRNRESDLCLPVGTVSRRHAIVENVPEGWRVRDLHSENGTWVNGDRIWEHLLADGDQVQFGTVALIFHLR